MEKILELELDNSLNPFLSCVYCLSFTVFLTMYQALSMSMQTLNVSEIQFLAS